MNRLELLIPPPVIMLFTGVFMWLLASMFPTWTLVWSASAAVAATVSLIGLALGLMGVVAFRRANTTADSRRPQETSTLVQEGVYRYSRNPMYLAVLIILIGWAIYLSNFLSALFIVVFIAYITRYQIIPEEQLLEKKFGDDFLLYKSRVRRWL